MEALVDESGPAARERSGSGQYQDTVDIIAGLIRPVDLYFEQVLVLDPKKPDATAARARFISEKLKPLLISYFDLRELSGQADSKAS